MLCTYPASAPTLTSSSSLGVATASSDLTGGDLSDLSVVAEKEEEQEEEVEEQEVVFSFVIVLGSKQKHVFLFLTDTDKY